MERGLPCVALREKLALAMAQEGGNDVLVDFVHPAPYGARIIADAIEEAIERAYLD